MELIWKQISGYNDKYLVSNTGIVKSLERKVKGKIKNQLRIQKERYLKPAVDGYGYLFVVLSNNGNKKTKKIHQLVANAFIGKCPKGKQINHKDGIKLNNLPENLEYVTPKENTNHSIYNLGHYRNGEYHWNSKLTKEKIIEIRKLYKTGNYTQSQLGKKFNIHRGQISKIINYKSWI